MISDQGTCIYKQEASRTFPDDDFLAKMGAEGYVGVPLFDSNGKPMGLIAGISRLPLGEDDGLGSILEFFAGRAAAEISRERSERLFTDVVDALPNSLTLKNTDKQFVFANRGFEDSFGLRSESVIGMTSDQLGMQAPTEGDLINQLDDIVFNTGIPQKSEIGFVMTNGDERTAVVSKFPVHGGDGEIDLVGTIWTDITEQKQTQQTLEATQGQLKAIFDNAPILLTMKDLEGRYLEVNRVFADWHNRDPDELVGKTLYDLVPKQSADAIVAVDRRVAETGLVSVDEVPSAIEHDDKGRRIYHRNIKFPVRDGEGRITGVGTAAIDVSRQRRAEIELKTHLEDLEDLVAERTAELNKEIAERRRAEQDVRQNEATLRQVLERSPVGVAIVARNPHRRLFVNQSFLDMFGAESEEQVDAVPMADTYVNPEQLAALRRRFDEEGGFEGVEVLRRRLDGTEWWTLMDARMVEFEGERAALNWHYDITARKQAEAELREREETLANILETTPAGVSVTAPNREKRIFTNRRFREMFGIESDNSDSFPIRDSYVDPTNVERVLEQYQRDGILEGGEFERYRADGSKWWCLMDFRPINFRGEPAILAWHYDITDRKQAERAILESEAQLRDALESSPIGATIVNEDGTFEFVNSRMAELAGMSKEEFLGSHARDFYVDPEERDRINERLLAEGRLHNVEAQFKRKDGQPLWISLSFEPWRKVNGKQTFFGWVYDIDDIKAAQRATQQQAEWLENTVAERTHELEENRGLLTSIIENIPIALQVKASDHRVEHVNRTYVEWYGLDPEDVMGFRSEAVLPFMDEEEAAEMTAQEVRVLAEGVTLNRQVERPFADGKAHTISITKFPIYDRDGNITRVGTASVDMTEQIEARSALVESEQLMRSIIDNLPVGLVVKDSDGRRMMVNNTFCRWYETTPDDAIGSTAEEFFGDRILDMDTARDHENRVISEGLEFSRETTRTFADGQVHNILVNKYPVRNASGETPRLVSLTVDLTDLRQRERELSTLIDNVPGLVFRADLAPDGDFQVLYVSEGVEPILGHTPDEVIELSKHGKMKFGHRDDLPWLTPAHIAAYGSEKPFEGKYRVISKSGEIRWVFERSRVVRRSERGWICEGLVIDITEQHEAEMALAESQAWLQALTDHVPIYLNLKDREGRLQFANARFADLLDQRPNDPDGASVGELEFHPDEWANGVGENDRHVLETGEILDYERPSRFPQLKDQELRVFKFAVKDDGDEIIGVGTAALDITEQKRAQDRQQLLFDAIETLPIAFALFDRDDRLVVANEYAKTKTSWREEMLVPGTTYEELIRDTAAHGLPLNAAGDKAEGWLKERLELHRTGEGATENLQPDGTVTLAVERKTKGGSTVALRFDITERKAVEDALKESEAWFRGLFENAPAGITLKDPKGRFIAVNKTYLDWKGWQLEDVIGRKPSDLVDGEAGLAIDVDGRTEELGAQTREIEIDCADGRKMTATNIRAPMLTPDGDVAGVCSFYVDITEMHSMEAQLQQAQKMEAVGRLAGGIAHDFNNLLGAILGFSSFLIEDLEDGTSQHNFANRIYSAGQRAEQVVAQLLAFSRMSSTEMKAIDLTASVDETMALLAGSLPSSTKVQFTRSVSQSLIVGNAGQLSQVLMNLAVNANDAFEGRDGSITFSVGPVANDDKISQEMMQRTDGMPDDQVDITETEPGVFQVLVGRLKPDVDYVRLSVADDGSGIHPDILGDMFDPFYTTKGVRKGTGLGLSVVRGIVASHGGAIRVITEGSVGTTFDLFFPVASDDHETENRELGITAEGRHGMILVVDDEIDVADMVQIGLERLGYQVAAAENGQEGLQKFKEAPEIWRAVIVDQVMPEMRGIDLIQEIKKLRPDVPTILCTGFSDSLTETRAIETGADAFFFKPVSLKNLAKTLAELLGN